jgi:hypothetical protein
LPAAEPWRIKFLIPQFFVTWFAEPEAVPTSVLIDELDAGRRNYRFG